MRTLALLLALACGAASAQQHEPANGVLLVAKPGLEDPNFGRSVVLVTQLADGQTLGVIVNKPTPARHAGQPLWFGGPVMFGSVVALFAAGQAPPAPAFHVLKDVYLTMHPENIGPLLERAGRTRFRLYSGFAAWAPGQLEREFGGDAWHVLPAEEALVFGENMEGLWEELIAKAKPRARRGFGVPGYRRAAPQERRHSDAERVQRSRAPARTGRTGRAPRLRSAPESTPARNRDTMAR